MGLFTHLGSRSPEKMISKLHTDIKKLRLKREEEEKKLRILDTQFDRQTEKGVFSEIDKKNFERITKTRSVVNHDLMKIIDKEERLVKRIMKFRSSS